MTRWILRMAMVGALASVAGCDGDGGDDAGPGDAGAPADAGEPTDAGDDSDAGGVCSELTPQFCPRQWPMTPIPADLICDAFIEPFCEANANCCDNPDWVYPAISTCEAEQRARCEDLMNKYEFADLFARGNIDYSQGAAGAEFSMAGALSSACEPVDFVEVIFDLYDGRLMANDPCMATPECRAGLTCEDVGTGPVCFVGLGPGGLCSTNEECDSSGLRCDTGAGECADRLPLGAGCADDLDCVTEYCEGGTCAEITAENIYCVRDIGENDTPAFRP